MTNIPTELLRTLLAVVELRSFTKAAATLGLTQPAVSTHVKRLQLLLGGDLFDKSAPGVALTEKGELIANYARRMLAINDQMLDLAVKRPAPPAVRIGMPGDFGGARLPTTLAAFRAQWPSVRFQVRSDASENLLRDLRQGGLDLAVCLTTSGPALDARHYWSEDILWARSAQNVTVPHPIPLASYGEGFLLHRIATSVLNQVGREYQLVFTAFSMMGLITAVAAGLGVSLLPRRTMTQGLAEWENGPMPKALTMYGGVYLRDGADRDMLEALADAIAVALKPGQGALSPHWPLAAPPKPENVDLPAVADRKPGSAA